VTGPRCFPGIRARYSRMTIKTRLVLNVAIAMAVVLAATSWFVFWRVELALDRQLNRDLRAYHNVVVEAQRTGGEMPRNTAGEWYQVFDNRYVVTEASKVLPDPSLLPREKFDQVMGGRRVHYNHGSFVPPDPSAFRTLATEVDLGSGEYVIATAISRQPRDEALHELLIQLAIADLLALLGAAFVGYRTARGALDPVERYRLAATAAGATPGGRMPVPQDRDDELTRLGNTLNGLLARVEESVQREHRFIADASHELRTPLALLKAEVELALHQPRTPEYNRTVLLSVQAEVERMVELANALLDLEELASDHTAPLEPVDVPALLGAVADRYRPSLERQGRDIRVEAPPELVAQLNQRWIDAALSNLVSNASRYGAGTVTLTAAAATGQLRMSVSDQGAGFPADFLAGAFDRFTRVDASRTTTGSGLGLALVKAVCQAHQGTATIEHAEGRATVTMTLPPAGEPLQLATRGRLAAAVAKPTM
jgi:two-component system, OmpR family, sensor kinase